MSESKDKSSVGLIAVMGGTGTGKSSFINAIVGQTIAPVGHGLESLTSDIEKFEYTTLEGLPVTLVDTPGFNDFRDGGGKSDLEILKMISAFLKEQFNDGQKFSGILYLHNINEPRIGTVLRRNMTMFKKLCGTDSMKNVVVVTTFWDSASFDDATDKETEIMTEEGFLKELLDGGASFVRSGHYGANGAPRGEHFPSPQKIVQDLLSLDPVFVEMQKELAAGLTVAQTAAGVELNKEFEELKRQYRDEMADVNARIEGIRVTNEEDRQARLELLKANEKLKSQVQKWEEEQRQMQLRIDDYHASLSHQKAEIPSEVDRLKQQHDRDLLELRNQIQSLTSNNSGLSSQKALLEQSCEQLKISLSESFSSIKQLRSTLNRERKERGSIVSEYRDLHDRLKARDEVEGNLQQKLHNSQLALLQKTSELQTAQAEQSDTLKELRDVKTALETSQQKNVAIASEMDDLRSTLGKVRADLKTAETSHTQAMAVLQDVRSSTKKKENNGRLPSHQNNCLKAQSEQDALVGLRKQHEQQNSELFECQLALIHAREELEAVRASEAKLLSELEDEKLWSGAHRYNASTGPTSLPMPDLQDTSSVPPFRFVPALPPPLPARQQNLNQHNDGFRRFTELAPYPQDNSYFNSPPPNPPQDRWYEPTNRWPY